jgi:ribonuclease HI
MKEKTKACKDALLELYNDETSKKAEIAGALRAMEQLAALYAQTLEIEIAGEAARIEDDD